MSGSAKELKLIKKVGLALLIVFLVITFIYLVKIANNDTCGRETYTDYGGGELQEAYTLTFNDEIVYQKNPYDRQKNIDEWRFCFTANATADIEVYIVNSRRYMIGRAILREGYYNYCYNVIFPPENPDLALLAWTETNNYIGIQCPTCDEQGTMVTLYEEILGVEVERTIESSGSYLVYDAPTLDFILHGAPSCWENIKYFTFWYLISLILLVLVAGAYKGKDKLKELLEE